VRRKASRVLEKGRVPKRRTGQEEANMTRAVQAFNDNEEEEEGVCRALLVFGSAVASLSSSSTSSSLPSSSCCRAN